MATSGEKGGDYYTVLGLNKDCSEADLRDAYKKLALRWHPDRCSASRNSKFVDEAKEKFQAIQEAYSVLSDPNKRLLYDVGVYNSDDDDDDDDDDENGMGDFIGEMAEMMSQTKPNDDGYESFEELQRLFVDMFQADLSAEFGGQTPGAAAGWNRATTTTSSSSVSLSHASNKRGSSGMNSAGNGKPDGLDPVTGGFCFGTNNPSGDPSSKGRGGGSNSKRRNGRKQKVSSKHDVSSRDAYDNTLVH